ncbi:MAG: hypothetical protein JRN68_07915 [Nitrososphaerota archaeon]|nr:hypothetical protein [Nitrososphaerota archaeon]
MKTVGKEGKPAGGWHGREDTMQSPTEGETYDHAEKLPCAEHCLIVKGVPDP